MIAVLTFCICTAAATPVSAESACEWQPGCEGGTMTARTCAIAEAAARSAVQRGQVIVLEGCEVQR